MGSPGLKGEQGDSGPPGKVRGGVFWGQCGVGRPSLSAGWLVMSAQCQGARPGSASFTLCHTPAGQLLSATG